MTGLCTHENLSRSLSAERRGEFGSEHDRAEVRLNEEENEKEYEKEND